MYTHDLGDSVVKTLVLHNVIPGSMETNFSKLFPVECFFYDIKCRTNMLCAWW